MPKLLTRIPLVLAAAVLAASVGAAVAADPVASAAAVSPINQVAAPTTSPVAAAIATDAAPTGSNLTIGGVKADELRATPVSGIVEVRRGGDIVYMTHDGQYMFTGDLFRVANRDDLTEAHRRELRRKLIDAVPESDMVVFSPPHPKYTITVFTDVDCAYCRALHRQIADYNRLGVRVRYVFFPRTGPNTESWFKAEQVWCAADRKDALTRAKLGEALKDKPCADTPVAQEYALGKAIGLEGTPGVISSNGDLIGGYLPPEDMVAALEQLPSGG